MNRVKLKLAGLLVCLWITSGLYAQNDPASNISLAEAQKIALENSFAVKSSKIDLSLAKKKIVETTSIGLPQITAKASYQHIFKIPELNFGKAFYVDKGQELLPIAKGSDLSQFLHATPPIKLGVPNNVTLDITASQLVFSGEYLVGLQASKTFYRFSEESLLKAERDIKESVAKAYSGACVLAENLKVIQSSLAVVDKMLIEMEAVNKQGLADETDVDQLRVTKLTLQNAISTLNRQKDIAVDGLKFQLGMDRAKVINLTDSVAGLMAGNGTAFADEAMLLANNIDFKLMETNVALTDLSYKRELSKYLPTVAAFYRHQENLKNSDFDMTMKDIFGASLEWPLFTSFGRNSRTAQAKLTLEKTKLAREQVGQGLMLEFDQTKNEYLSATDKVNMLKETMKLTKRIFERTVIKYKQGLATSFDISRDQSQFLTAQKDYYMAVMDYLGTKSKLEKLLTKN